MVVGLLGSLVPTGVASAETPDPDAVAIGRGLASLAGHLDGLGAVPVLAADLPLTTTSPAEVLGLDAGILAATLGTATADPQLSSLDALATAIDDADHTDAAAGLEVSFSDASAEAQADGSVGVAFDLAVERSVDVPVGHRDGDDVLLLAGEVTGLTATLAGRLTLTYDPTEELDGGSRALVLGTPTLTLDLAADDQLTEDARYGFSDVAVAGTAATDLGFDVALVDPDGEGGITRGEWETTLPGDLSAVTAAGSYAVTAGLDSDLVDGSEDGTIAADVAAAALDVDASDPADVWPAPTVAIGDELAALATINADDVLVGLGQLAGLLTAAQARGDAGIPFTDASVADLHDPGRELADYIGRQGDALVVCGRADTSPPSGSRRDGDPLACQAFAGDVDTAEPVTWRIDGETVTDAAGTSIGAEPTTNVTVASASADPTVTVTFTPLDGDGPVTAERRFRSAQELEADLGPDGLGFDVALGLDPDARTLELGLARSDASVSVEVDPVSGDVFREASRLAGLEANSGPLTITGTDAAFDVALGWVLGEEDPDAPIEDDTRLRASTRTFLRDGDGAEISLGGLAGTDTSAAWDGRIGYLPVTVAASDLAIAGGTDGDALAIELPAAGEQVALPADDRAETAVTDAVLVRDLLDDLSGVTATSDLSGTADLTVTDAAGLGASGTIAVTGWDQAPQATLGSSYLEDLHVFDVAPTVTGVVTGDGDATTLSSADAGFLTAFGQRLPAGTEVGATLANITRGATCTGFTVTSDDQLACTGELTGPPATEGGTDVHTWQAGDRFEVRGDPDALAPVVVEALFDLANRLDTAALDPEDPWRRALPLVGVAPDQLVDTLAEAATSLGELRTDLTAAASEEADSEVDLPQDLAELETELSDRLGAPVAFGLADVPRDVDGSATDTTHLTVAVTLDGGETVEVPLQVDLDPYWLTTEEGADGVAVTTDTSATLDLAIPLSLDVAPTDVWVGAPTGVTVDASFDVGADDELALAGRVGPIDVQAVAVPDVTGTHDGVTVTGTDDRSTAVTDDDPPVREVPPSATELLDADAGFDAAGVTTGLTVEKVVDDAVAASCEITAVAAGSVTCADGLSGGQTWDAGDAYRIAVPSATVLRDTDASFDGTVVAGDQLQKLSDGGTLLASCTVTTVAADALTCADGLRDAEDAEVQWHDGDSYRVPGAAGLQLDVTASLDPDAGALADVLADLAGTLTGGDVCGGGQDDACAELKLIGRDADDAEVALGTVGHLDDVDDDAPATIVFPGALSDAIDAAALDFGGLDDATGFVPGILRDGLDGRLDGTRLPLVGTDLDGGDVPDAVDELLGDLDLGGAIDAAVAAAEDDARLDEVIEGAVATALTGIDHTVEVACDGNCRLPYQVSSVTVDLQASGADLTDTVPFETGLPGLQLTVDGDDEVATEVDWDLDVVVGVDRAGPFVEAGDGGLLAADVAAEIDGGGGCDPIPGALPTTDTYSADRCLEGTVGLLPATLYDRSGDGASSLDATVTVDLGERLGLADLLDRPAATVEVADDSTGEVDLLFVSTETGTVISLPTIAGSLSYGYTGAGGFTDPAYADVGLDLGTFLPGFVGPVLDEVLTYIEPLEPIVDTLLEPIPVVSDLSKATGNGPVSLLTLLQKVSGNQLGLIERVGALLQLASKLDGLSDTGFIELTNDTARPGSGSLTVAFTVPVSEVSEGPCGSTPGQRSCSKTTTSVGTSGATYSRTRISEVGKNQTPVSRTASGTATASGAGVTFPFLNDSSEIYGMILGFDATLVRFDAGTLAATASLSVGFGPFMAGPVPVEVSLGGSITLQGRFAMGFDTRGLRRAAAGGSVGEAILDGIYIDDFDSNGSDVAEAQLIFTVTVGASVSVKIFKVGIEGGVTLKFLLDLDDRLSGPDGKLRIDTIRQYGHAPLCLFEFSSTLEFFLGLFLEIDLKIFTKKLSWELWRLKPPIELFSVNCELPPPVWASPVGDDLHLNIGSRASHRGRFLDQPDEIFQVRQMGAAGQGADGGTDVEVTFEGIPLDYTVPAGGRIVADAGGGTDVIQLLPGATEDGDEIAFTLGSSLQGGDGPDQLDGGTGADRLDGGPGRDVVRGGIGDDVLLGGDGQDTLEGGLGDDRIDGGGGDDRLTGAAGSDLLLGGAGDDRLESGPGLRKGVQPDADLEDGRNVLVGGPGDDQLEGGHLADLAFGDAAPAAATTTSTVAAVLDALDSLTDAEVATACAVSADGDGHDTIDGGKGADVLVGGGGRDRVDGGEGTDALCGGAGDDRLDGGDGADTLAGGSDHDRLHGGAADDVIDGGDGDDLLDGGVGADTLVGGPGADVADAGDGHDRVHGDQRSGDDLDDTGTTTVCARTAAVLDGGLLDLDGDGTADDGRFAGYTVTAGELDVDGDGAITAADSVVLIDGEVVVDAGRVDAHGAATVPGLTIVATGNADCLFGGADDDVVRGGGGGDHVHGDAGDDTLRGDAGDDLLRGADGDDLLRGDDGADTLFGDAGEDELRGDAGDDVLRGGLDDDRLSGGDDDDLLYGDAGEDVIDGDAGADTAFGGADDDLIRGNQGGDELYGDSGDDVIIGGSSAAGAGDVGDVISGGDGQDLVAGDNATYDEAAHTFDLHDVDRVDAPADAGTSGGDTILGDAGQDRVYGQGGDDRIDGGAADDHLEGGHGDDDLFGDGGDDDLIGGTSADEAGRPDRDTYPSDLTDGEDVLLGGGGDDLLLGDHATVTRGDGFEAGGDAPPVRTVVSALASPDPAGAFGDDRLFGEGGRDQLFGQLGDDLLDGGAADDVLVGDLGTAAPTVRDTDATFATRAPFVSVTFPAGSVRWDVELFGFLATDGASGADALLGGDGADSLHAGPGDDVLDGGTDSDEVFGGGGDDLAWGGPGVDRLWGGSGEDFLDVPDGELDGVVPGAVDLTGYGRPLHGTDPADDDLPTLDGRTEGAEGFLGQDVIYGGLDQDVMLADEGDAGRVPGDRLIDAVGNHNAFLRCANAYGEGVVTRQIGPPLRTFLQRIAAEGGALGAATAGTSGFDEAALVFPRDASSNSKPHPSVPSSGFCQDTGR